MRDAVTLPISFTNALNGRLSYPVPDIESHLCVSMNYLSFITTRALKYRLHCNQICRCFYSLQTENFATESAECTVQLLKLE